MGARQQLKIAGLLVEQIGVRKQLAFERREAQTKALDDLCFTQPLCIVAKIRMAIQACPPLPKSPAFDQNQFALRHLALQQLVQQLVWRSALVNRIAAGLDGRIRPLDTGQQGKQETIDLNSGFLHLHDRSSQATPCGYPEVEWCTAQRQGLAGPPPQAATCHQNEHKASQEYLDQEAHGNSSAARRSCP